MGSNIKLGNAGVITATSFSGSGANLTGITQVGGGNSVTFNDGVAANFGSSNDFTIFHDGAGHTFLQDQGNGALRIRSDSEVAIQSYVSLSLIHI